jgi:tetratricopeptide (TPR) repeat protein
VTSTSHIVYLQLRRIQQQEGHDAFLAALEPKNENDPRICLLRGISLFLTGQKEQALADLSVEVHPNNAAEWSDYGLALLLAGKPGKAKHALEQAVSGGDAGALEYSRLAFFYLTLADLDNARQYYQEAVDREPGRAEWHNNLAGILVRQQKLEEALENYQMALSLKPDLQQSINARQRVLIALERTEDVVEQLEKELKDAPDNAELKIRLARALKQDNRPTEAIRLLRQSLLPLGEFEKPDELAGPGKEKSEAQQQWEDQLGFRVLLADIFGDKGMHGMAMVALNQILELRPENPVPFIVRKVHALTELGRYDKAEELLSDVDKEYPDTNPLKLARASLYCESERYAEAEAIQRELLETYPGDAGLKSQLAQTLLWTGKLDEAADLFEQAAEQNPLALAQMVNAKRIPEDEAALKKMATVADNPLLAAQARITMSFALSVVYDKCKDIDQAWHYLDLANRLTEKGLNYNTDAYSKSINILIETYSADFFAKQQPIRNSDRTPIFVVGMPRSGTTLTEQILSSHPGIFGAGELDLMARLVRMMHKVLKTRIPYPKCLNRFTPHLREEAARFYLHGLYQYDRDHNFVVDKMPHNFEKLGLIALIFPKAKIIHVQRDPRDTAVSNFQQNFKARHGGLGYAFNLEKIALQINDYRRMMAHWRKVLPIPMFEFWYEDLVSDQDEWSKKLLEFVGVEWDISVHDFHKTERAVRTASVTQVRQPIYKTSKQKWRRYERYLAPLLDNLEDP